MLMRRDQKDTSKDNCLTQEQFYPAYFGNMVKCDRFFTYLDSCIVVCVCVYIYIYIFPVSFSLSIYIYMCDFMLRYVDVQLDSYTIVCYTSLCNQYLRKYD